jgi:excisionase family DNA binding protein
MNEFRLELPDDLLERYGQRLAEMVADRLADQANSTPWLSVGQAAEHLGITEQAIRSLLKRGDIPAYRPNGRVFLDRAELDSWVRSGREAHQTRGGRA